MTKAKWMMVCLPFVGCFALLGCPKSENAASDAAGPSPVPLPSDTTAAQPTAAGSTADGGKPTTTTTSTVVLPHLNLDGAAGLIDAGMALLADAAMPTIPSMPDAATSGVTGVPPECTAYAAQQNVCIGKMNAALQPAAKAALGAAQGSWPSLSSTPAGHDALQTQCKSLLAQANACK